MPEEITLSVNGSNVTVPGGVTVAVAIVLAGAHCRKSVSGEPRTVLCGMGVCFECRAEVDGVPHLRSCQLVCSAGIQVNTDV